MTHSISKYLIFFLLASLTFAGVGGKISGSITSESGEPLIGANIIISGTDHGTATNENGEYYILNITPGHYTVKIMMIGYKTSVQADVIIMSDFTTQLNVGLPQSVIEGEEVQVTASRPLIQKDATSSVKVIDSESIVDMPVNDFKDILVTQAGFTEDASGGIHVRGGRTKEILYMIDGVVVKDPLQGDFSGSVNQNAIQEMTVISGTFNAEYGQAMSSVVNIVTKDGGDKLQGKVEFISPELSSSIYHSPGAFNAVSDSNYQWTDLKEAIYPYLSTNIEQSSAKPLLPLFDLPLSGSGSFNLGGRLPFGNTHFYFSSYYSSKDSQLPHGFDVNQDVQFKLTTKPNPKTKIAAHIHSSNRLYQNYSHQWKYRPLYQGHTFKSNDRLALTFTHAVSEPLFYSLYLTLQDVASFSGVMDKMPLEYERPLTDKTVYFYDVGNRGSYIDNHSQTYSLKYDLTYQANQNHLIKTGFTVTPHALNIHIEEQPWVGGTNFKDDTTFTPIDGSFYIQDKIELDFLIFNLGLRWDYVDPQASMWQDINRFVEWDSTNNVWAPAELTPAPAQSNWSPRIGLAYPVTDNTVFHFSYGHFFQTPTFDAMTYNAKKDVSSALPLVGNPNVSAQKTIAFETGLKQALSNNLAMEFSIWSKDIRDLLSTVQIRYLSNMYVAYANTDYASVKGFNFLLDQRFSGIFGGSFAYTMSVAKGNNSNPIGGYFSAYVQEEVPHQEFFLDFDQRHDFSISAYVRTHKNSGFSLGGMKPLANINASILVNAGSGLPYTPYVDPTLRVEVNSARKPWTFTADLRIKKRLNIKSFAMTGFLEIKNLTNYENVYYVYSRTGKPFDPGVFGVGTSLDANYNPTHVGQGRNIKAGVSVTF
ncbi:MAG: TonB-dependent receptor [Candidatus Marinimicrobia bacterium]|nr:TonB-dependent receptor [Candidatus Neomarinimicrobiota bacterium]